MRRLGRILLNAATVLSLLLCVASASLWVRGYWRWDSMSWFGRTGHGGTGPFLGLASGGGTVAIRVGRHIGPNPWALGERYWMSYQPTAGRFAAVQSANRWGLGYESAANVVARWRGVLFPAWLAAAVFALSPCARLALYIRRRRQVRHGYCHTCGYDLRATPERCPECGTLATL